VRGNAAVDCCSAHITPAACAMAGQGGPVVRGRIEGPQNIVSPQSIG